MHRAVVYFATFALFGIRPSVEEWVLKASVKTSLLLLLVQPELWRVALLGALVSLNWTEGGGEPRALVRDAAAGACVTLLAVVAADYFEPVSFFSAAAFCQRFF